MYFVYSGRDCWLRRRAYKQKDEDSHLQYLYYASSKEQTGRSKIDRKVYLEHMHNSEEQIIFLFFLQL